MSPPSITYEKYLKNICYQCTVHICALCKRSCTKEFASILLVHSWKMQLVQITQLNLLHRNFIDKSSCFYHTYVFKISLPFPVSLAFFQSLSRRSVPQLLNLLIFSGPCPSFTLFVSLQRSNSSVSFWGWPNSTI